MFGITFSVIFVISITIIIIACSTIIRVKIRKEIIGKQGKFIRQMLDESKDLYGESTIFSKDGVEIKNHSVNTSFSSHDFRCKYCAAKIDSDSIYCKICGKEQ